jgi:hypothetical protein
LELSCFFRALLLGLVLSSHVADAAQCPAYPARDRKLDSASALLRIRFTDVLHFSHGRWLAVAAQETDVH